MAMKTLLPVLIALLLPAPCIAAAPGSSGDGLLGSYYNYSSNPQTLALGNQPYSLTLSGTPVLQRIDPTINFNWSTSAPASMVQQTQFAVAWTGAIQFPRSDSWALQTQSDDGIRVYIDFNDPIGSGQSPNFSLANLLIDDWTLHPQTADYWGFNYVPQGLYPILIEYFQNQGAAVAQLNWLSYQDWLNGAPWQTVPQADLYSLQGPSLQGITQPCGSSNTLELLFSAPLDRVSASKTANYSLDNGAQVLAAGLDPNNADGVILSTSNLTIGSIYHVLVNNVLGSNGYAVAANSSAAVTVQGGTQYAPGLQGNYYNQNGIAYAFFTGQDVSRIDPSINFNWGNQNSPIAGIPGTDFSVRWTGYVQVPRNDSYTFSVTSDDGNRFWLNGNQIINAWQLQSATTDTAAPVNLKAGQYYPIQLDYFQHLGFASVQLSWQSKHLAQQIIPASQLFYCQASLIASISISAAAQASTCTPQPVSFIVLDSSGVPMTAYTGTLQISTSSGHGSWSLGPGAAGSLSSGNDTGSAVYTFSAADQGQVTLLLSDQHADILSIAATSSGASGQSSGVSFSDNAFVITSIDPIGNDVVAGRPQQLQAQLWTRNGSGGAQCQVASTYSGARNLKAWVQRGPLDPGGYAPNIAGNPLPNSPPSSNNISLNFVAGTATFALGSSDVGQLALNLLDDSSGYAVNLSGGNVAISGSSPIWAIRPFGFAIDFSGDRQANGLTDAALSYADNANDTPYFSKAGDNFSVTVQAVLWQSNQDSNNDGQPDPGSNLIGDAPTPHFNASVALAPVEILPNPGNVGVLSPLSISGFSNGSATTSASYSEVGIIQINANLNNYLGGINTVQGNAPNVGRFVPDHLALVAGSGSVTPACSSGFTYMQQMLQAGFTLAAQNLSGTTTSNYVGAFAKLQLNSPGSSDLLPRAIDMGVPATPLSSRLSLGMMSGNTWTGGLSNAISMPVSLNAAAQPDGSFDHFTLGIAPVDSDGIGITGMNLASSGGSSFDAVSLGSSSERYGRLWISDASGSELLPLSMTVSAQYYASVGGGHSDFILNSLDTCTSLPLTPTGSNASYGDYLLSNPQGGVSTSNTQPSYSTPYSALLQNGQTQVQLSAPGVTGSILLSLPQAPAWLRLYPYHSTQAGIAPTTPSGLATFGVYGGRAPVIYWHPTYR